MNKNFSVGLAALIVILGISLVLPAVGNFSNAAIGRDAPLTMWVYWWPRRAIALNSDVMITDYLLYPFPQNLLPVLSPFASLLYGILTSVLSPALTLSPVLAFNLLYVIGSLFSGLATLAYLRARHVALSLSLAGTMFLLLSPVTQNAIYLGRPDLLFWGWIPLWLIVWESSREDGHYSRLQTVLLSILACGVLFTNIQILVAAVLVWSLRVIIDLLNTANETRVYLVRNALWTALVLFIVGLAYPIPGLLKVAYGLAPTVFAHQADVPLWELGGTIYLLVGAGAVVLALWKGVPRVGWGLMSAGFLVLAWAAPRTLLVSEADLLLPALIALVIFVVLSLATVTERAAFSILAGMAVVTGIVTATRPVIPIHLWEEDSAYRVIGAETGDYAVLTVPFEVWDVTRNAGYGINGADLMEYAVVHGKRSIGGLTFHVSSDMDQTYQHSAVLALFTGDLTTVPAPARHELEQMIYQWRIGYIVVHITRLAPDAQRTIINFLDGQQTLCPAQPSGDGVIVYRTRWYPIGC